MAIFGKKQSRSAKSRYRVGLALSGGGTRGIAHIGVIKAFCEQNIDFCCVAGTSAGSLVGAMYAAGIPCEQMIEVAKSVSRREILNARFLIGSKSSNIAQVAARLLGGKTFDDLSLPFAAVAVDISTGCEVVLNSGDVATAVSASCAVPALFTPVRIGDMVLVDGGLLNNMPADVCRQMGADIVIGVDLNSTRGKGTTSNSLKDTLIATWNITTKSTMYKGLHNSDVVIEPDLEKYKSTRLDGIDEMVLEGYNAAMNKMQEIKELLQIRD